MIDTTYYAGSACAPDLSHGGLRGGESAFRTCQWVSDSVQATECGGGTFSHFCRTVEIRVLKGEIICETNVFSGIL